MDCGSDFFRSFDFLILGTCYLRLGIVNTAYSLIYTNTHTVETNYCVGAHVTVHLNFLFLLKYVLIDDHGDWLKS